MIDQFLIIFSAILIYEFLKYFNLIKILGLNIKVLKKILRLFKLNKVSDTRKELLIFNYSKSLFISSIKILVILLSILFFLFFVSKLSSSFINLIISFLGILEITIIFLLYHKLKKKFYAKL